MALNIEAVWSDASALRSARFGAIYQCENLQFIPKAPGVYIFCRAHGDLIAPLYIGRALNLQRRIEQQLNSVRLMTGIRDAPSGTRLLIYCVPQLKRGQKASRVVKIMESALIAHALAENFELLQKQGTKKPNHTIRFKGNRISEAIVPRRMRVGV